MKIPGKKVGVILITTVTLVTTVVTVSILNENSSKKEIIIEKSLGLDVKNTNDSKDTDGDGLTDWEETLWGTNIDLGDTDSDGTKDGEEVSLGRNPLIKGPDDMNTEETQNLGAEYEPGEIDENSFTTKVAKSVFTNFINLHSNGGATREDAEIMAKQVIEEVDRQILLSNKYSISDIIIFDSDDKEKIKEYGNTIPKIFIDELRSSTENKSSDTSLDPIAFAYSEIVRNLLLIPTPKDLAEVHVSMLNDLNNMSILMSTLNKSDKDPVLVALLIPKIQKISESQNLSTEKISKYMLERGIIFENGEHGLLLYNK